ncbi:MAG: DUF2017 family protein [Planctomycetota bacterium]
MWAARAEDGYLIGGLTRTCVESLRGVPMLLESNDERVRQRLLPETYQDAEEEVQWRRHAAPELERLFLSRAQLVRKDLAAMRQLKSADSWVLIVPDTHTNAWLASLNAARVALYVLNDLKAHHLEREGETLGTEKQREAVQRIHFLAEIQCILMGEVEALDDFGCDGDDPDPDHDLGSDFGDGGGDPFGGMPRT